MVAKGEGGWGRGEGNWRTGDFNGGRGRAAGALVERAGMGRIWELPGNAHHEDTKTRRTHEGIRMPAPLMNADRTLMNIRIPLQSASLSASISGALNSSTQFPSCVLRVFVSWWLNSTSPNRQQRRQTFR